jgi:uncharacterized membrane protein YphA (DoxX/SURF4 family)
MSTSELMGTANAPRGERLWSWLTLPFVRWLGLLGLCAAYLQGGIVKATDFAAAVAEMQHFGLAPAAPFAVAVILLELGGSVLVLSGRFRWLGALALGGFTLLATLLANRFWEMAPPERFGAANSFFEHLGLVGGFLLVAHYDWRSRTIRARHRASTTAG